ncbi:Flp family type IVb pilin [Sandaracinobacter neustonicus]|uniref:Flp family type IVb pilin n=2 Tax=Sandaracinobacter neustonicus TaxID=1715348 RepID=A0A501XN20_9SPHN|nr:Flp family type IVb pilin [Sandaracinobacter neustonicus]
MLGDKAGASAAEYALILAVIGVGVAVAFGQLGGAIKGKVESATSKISTADAS